MDSILFQSFVLEIVGTNVSTTYITCPADPKKTLGIKLPYLVMIVKNMKKYYTFEVQVLDDKNVRRRFRASNYQSTTRVKPFICTMPMRQGEYFARNLLGGQEMKIAKTFRLQIKAKRLRLFNLR